MDRIDALLADGRQRALALEVEVGKAVIGQSRVIRLINTAVFARGHVLLQGDVGVGKTTLLRAFAQVLGGDFAQRLAHPSFEVDKTYVAEVEGEVHIRTIRRLLEGVMLEDGPIKPTRARVVGGDPRREARGKSIVELTIHEGRNRIVRRLLDEVGHPVTKLTRTAIGPLTLAKLPSGQMRELTLGELGELMDSTQD